MSGESRNQVKSALPRGLIKEVQILASQVLWDQSTQRINLPTLIIFNDISRKQRKILHNKKARTSKESAHH